jgi:hypothetical protein
MSVRRLRKPISRSLHWLDDVVRARTGGEHIAIARGKAQRLATEPLLLPRLLRALGRTVA